MRRSAMRRVSSSWRLSRLQPTTAAAASEARPRAPRRAAPRPACGGCGRSRSRRARSGEYADRRAGAGGVARDGDGLRAGARSAPRRAADQRARRRRDRHDDAVRAGLLRGAPAEGRFLRAPWRQAVDLGAHHALEKFAGALRQLQRPEQEARGPAASARRGAAQHRGDAVGMRAGDMAIDDLARARTAGRTACDCLCSITNEPFSSSITCTVLRDRSSSARATIAAATASIQRETQRADFGEARHRASARVSSTSSRQVRTRYGSVPLSSTKITLRWSCAARCRM